MSDNRPNESRREFRRMVGRKASRRIEARSRHDSVWSWLGMLGLIGWSVAIPTVAGVAFGLWLDREAPAAFSWVLTMLALGLGLGLLNAWLWVRRESEGESESRNPDPEGPGSEEVSEQ
jgi:ATP synthase protein I